MKQTASGLVVPNTVSSPGAGLNPGIQDHEGKLSAQFEGLKKLETHFPGLVRICFGVAQKLTNYMNTKRIKPEDIAFEPPKWRNDGYIVFRVYHKGKPLPPMDVDLS